MKLYFALRVVLRCARSVRYRLQLRCIYSHNFAHNGDARAPGVRDILLETKRLAQITQLGPLCPSQGVGLDEANGQYEMEVSMMNVFNYIGVTHGFFVHNCCTFGFVLFS